MWRNIYASCFFFLKRRRLKYLLLVVCLISTLVVFMPQQKGALHIGTKDLDDSIFKTFHETLKNQNGQVCVHPQLDPFHPSVTGFFHDVPLVECKTDEDWVFVDNGTFRISKRAKRRHGRITCEYAPLVRGPNDYSVHHGDHIKPMPDGSPIRSDFFKVACVTKTGRRYFNIHSGIVYNKTLHQRSQKTPLPETALGLDVLMFGFDSISKMTWIRKLPKTREYFLKNLNGIELEGYNIVGDGTPQALLPILTGKTEEELPEARRGKPGAKPVDGHPWIWKEFQKLGYVTLWAEDMAFIGTFQYRMLGFNHQPTDHSMRTFYLAAERMYGRNKRLCIGSQPRHKIFLKWFRDAYLMYDDKPKFMFAFHSEASHDDNNMVQVVDEDARDFLKFLEDRGYLNRTILIMMSDHGSRFSKVRATAQGKVEERMPYFAFRFPPWFQQKYPEVMRNFRINTHRLTTPFDIHETFHDVINFSGARTGNLSTRGISLFQEIPKERTCAHAGIEPHWCACLAWEEVNQSDPMVQQVVQSALDAINEWTSPHRSHCAFLTLSSVTRSVKYSTNSNVLKYRKSSDADGRVADLSGLTTSDEDYYQVTFTTDPNRGQFEITVKHSANFSNVTVSDRDVSRINRYGSDPDCIAKDFPHLRPCC